MRFVINPGSGVRGIGRGPCGGGMAFRRGRGFGRGMGTGGGMGRGLGANRGPCSLGGPGYGQGKFQGWQRGGRTD